MSETKRIQAFNDQLERLLAADASQGGPSDELNEQDRDALRAAAVLAGVEFDAEMRPRSGLFSRDRRSSLPAPRPAAALRWGWAALVIAVLALLVVFRDPVAASLGRLFGFTYIPGAGFVQVDTARVLKNPVMQVNNDLSLSVLRGLSTARDTQLWLEYSDGARAANGAWLETPDGQRFELAWWGWEPDEPGTHGVRLMFPTLPAEVIQVTLALPEGWRIPLEWIPAAESSLEPADLVVEQALPTPAEGDATPEVTEIVDQAQPCVEAAGLRMCAQAAARSAQGLELMLEAQSSGELKPGLLQDYTLLAFAAGDARLRLLDAQGGEYLPSEAIQLFPLSEERLGEGLVFKGAQNARGRLTLDLPGFFAHLPLTHEIVVDLGEDPQPGQKFVLDETIQAAGMVVHFKRAVIEQDDSGSLRLKVFSEPVETRDGVSPYILMMGRPERVDSGYGEGSEENGVLSLSVDLQQPSGKLSGILRLPLVGMTVRVNGPFSLSFDAPAEQVAATETPQVIEDGAFIPLPTGEALPVDNYQFSGRALQPGDLLAVSAGVDSSGLYAASQDGPAEIVAGLPGQVMALYVHPDRGGIDYITGAVDPDRGNRYEQLYTLRFDEGAPRLLAGSFEPMAHGFRWSADGRWLAYLAPRSGPGESDARQVHLVDLACRESGDCLGLAVDAPDNLDLRDLAWSPVEDRLLATGVPQTQSYGMSDVFTIKIDPDLSITLTNLTESPEIDDQGAQWLAEGKKLFITCSTSSMESNYYGLCRNDLQVGMDQLVIERLPYNMRLALLAPDGQTLVDRSPVFENGVLKLRAYHIATEETTSLGEWPALKAEFIEPAISSDGQSVGVVEPGLLSLLIVNLADGQSRPVLQAQQPLTWVGWVR